MEISKKAYFTLAESDIQKSIEMGKIEKVDIELTNEEYEFMQKLMDEYSVSEDAIVNGILHLYINEFSKHKVEGDEDVEDNTSTM